MKSLKTYDNRLKKFWDHGLCPITGFDSTGINSRVKGSGILKTLTVPKADKNGYRQLKFVG